jgi:competence protein ComGC
MSNQIIKLIQGRINQYNMDNKRAANDTTKLFNQGAIQGLKQAIEIIEGRS